ncbi:MAG: FHA domain-containing protein [Pseudomonadota bacterium]
MLGADFNGRLLSVARDGKLVGSAASRLRVRTTGLSQSIPALLDAFREQLDGIPPGPLWASVTSGSTGTELGELLRALRTARFEVQGFVDGAALCVAWAGLPGQSLVLDLHPHWLDLSLVSSVGDAVELRRTARVPVGRADLFEYWLRLAAQTLVQQTRFDPLHDQRHELQLRAALEGLATRAQRDGQVQMEFDVEGRHLDLTLSRDQLQQAAAPWCQALAAALQPLCAAAGDCNLVVPGALLDLPGIDDALAVAHAGSLHALAEGTSARAASLLPASEGGARGAVPYLTRVTALLPPAGESVCREVLHGARRVGTMATHVVYRGRAIPIPEQGMVLGRAEVGAHVPPQGLQLPEGIAGLSRRHCTLQRSGDRTQIIDHSRHGTFVDGRRVHGRGILAAGSVLRLGTPGIELPLIALGASGN